MSTTTKNTVLFIWIWFTIFDSFPSLLTGDFLFLPLPFVFSICLSLSSSTRDFLVNASYLGWQGMFHRCVTEMFSFPLSCINLPQHLSKYSNAWWQTHIVRRYLANRHSERKMIVVYYKHVSDLENTKIADFSQTWVIFLDSQNFDLKPGMNPENINTHALNPLATN